MAKDPAFLFYPGDWLGGTMTFSRAQKGAYIDLLITQFNSGHMSEQDIKDVLGADYDDMWERKLKSKFKVDEAGLYFNQKLDACIQERKQYTENRLKNLSGGKKDAKPTGGGRKSHKDSHMGNHKDGHKDSHMENHVDSHMELHMNGHTGSHVISHTDGQNEPKPEKTTEKPHMDAHMGNHTASDMSAHTEDEDRSSSKVINSRVLNTYSTGSDLKDKEGHPENLKKDIPLIQNNTTSTATAITPPTQTTTTTNPPRREQKPVPYKTQLIGDIKFIEALMMNWNLDHKGLQKMIADFEVHSSGLGKAHTDYFDYRKHFKSRYQQNSLYLQYDKNKLAAAEQQQQNGKYNNNNNQNNLDEQLKRNKEIEARTRQLEATRH